MSRSYDEFRNPEEEKESFDLMMCGEEEPHCEICGDCVNDGCIIENRYFCYNHNDDKVLIDWLLQFKNIRPHQVIELVNNKEAV